MGIAVRKSVVALGRAVALHGWGVGMAEGTPASGDVSEGRGSVDSGTLWPHSGSRPGSEVDTGS